MRPTPDDVAARAIAIFDACARANEARERECNAGLPSELIAAAIVADAIAGVAEMIDESGVELSNIATAICNVESMLDKIDDRLLALSRDK